ncbi:MAG: DUF4097 family beta strand repeat protein [Clostridia bacterium]|nr:DUF4097 family beta strand repeat protein [Clostridia bacterium]
MRNNAIIRIVLYSVSILLALGVLLLLLGVFPSPFSAVGEYEHRASSGETDAASVKNIDVSWVSGSVVFKRADTDKIEFYEEGSFPEKDKMVWSQTGDRLKLRYKKSAFGFEINFGTLQEPNKDLTVVLPRDWEGETLFVEAVSATVDASELKCDALRFSGVNGAISGKDLVCNRLEVESVSGELNLAADFKKLDIDSVSANCNVTVLGEPREISFEGVSGNLDLVWNGNVGFACELDVPLSAFESDFETVNRGDTRVYGDGACEIALDSISGKLNIRKAQ